MFPSFNAKCFVRFYAICKECKATLNGKMFKKPHDGQDAIFDCALIGFNNQINHIKKRLLKGSFWQKIAGYLIDAKNKQQFGVTKRQIKLWNLVIKIHQFCFRPVSYVKSNKTNWIIV